MNTFDEIFDNEDLKIDLNEEKEIRWEEATVKHILGRFNIRPMEKVLRTEHANRLERALLRAELFHEYFPDFPIYFGTRYMLGLHRNNACMMPNVINNFSRTPIVKAFEDFIESTPDDRMEGCVGVVFPRRGYQRGMIIHTGHGFWRPNVARLVYDYGKPNSKKRLVVEPFGELIKWIARHRKWSPTS